MGLVGVMIIFSSPGHKVLRVSYCDRAVLALHCALSPFCLVYALEATIFSLMIMKLGQKVCLDEIKNKIENWS